MEYESDKSEAFATVQLDLHDQPNPAELTAKIDAGTQGNILPLMPNTIHLHTSKEALKGNPKANKVIRNYTKKTPL